MNLRHLCSAPSVEIYFDSWNNWLLLEWSGELTLSTAQQAALAIARCFVAHAYPRVLTDNAGLAHVEPEAVTWLAQHFMPYLGLAGVQQLAWVHGPGAGASQQASQVLRYLGLQVQAALFAEAEEAVSWLQRVRPSYATGVELLPRHGGPQDTRLKYLLKTFEQEVAATRAPTTTLAPVKGAVTPALTLHG